MEPQRMQTMAAVRYLFLIVKVVEKCLLVIHLI